MQVCFYPLYGAFLGCGAVGTVMVATKWAPREHGGEGCPTAKPNTFEFDEMGTKQKGRETPTDGAGGSRAKR